MTSAPPGACCTRGVKHEGTPTGTFEQIGDIKTYISRPPTTTSTPTHAIIIFSDIFGIFANSQLKADSFAARGYVTILPDLFAGDALTLENYLSNPAALPEWLPKHAPEHVDPIVEKVIAHVKGEMGIEKIAGVGYCYGGRHVVRSLHKDGGLDAGFLAHPSFVTTEEFTAIAKPVAIAACEFDSIFTQDNRYESEKILIKSKVPFQINLYSGVEHGFALRADISVKKNKYAMEDAFQQAVTWFRNWM